MDAIGKAEPLRNEGNEGKQRGDGRGRDGGEEMDEEGLRWRGLVLELAHRPFVH